MVFMSFFFVLFLGITVAAALPATKEEFKRNSMQRIVGGELTTIDRYPFGVSLLMSMTGLVFSQSCGGTIINNRSILSAAHCFLIYRLPAQWRSRVGSTFANSGGVIYTTSDIIRHPNFHVLLVENDFAILRLANTIWFSNIIQPANIAGPNYFPRDNEEVWAMGWGTTCYRNCPSSEQLRHVNMLVINQEVCRQRYAELRYNVADNMICTGWLDIGGRDMCQGDSGGPVLHNGVVVGVSSWGEECAHPRYPAVNARVSSASQWIVATA